MPSLPEKKRVMAFGTFDYFHAGHEDYLAQAKALGDELIVVVAREDTVNKVKGQKPTHSERQRLKNVANCKHVDRAVLGNSDDKYKVLKKHQPQIVALGYDQFIFTQKLRPFFIKEGMDVEIVRLKAFKPEAFKSSLLRACDPDSNTILSVS